MDHSSYIKLDIQAQGGGAMRLSIDLPQNLDPEYIKNLLEKASALRAELISQE